MSKQNTKENFLARTKLNPTTGCLEWQGCKYDKRFGYGAIMWKGIKTQTHRLAWKLEYGSIPDGKQVLHKCDNRICVNPEHLFLGDYYDNNHDKINKDRCWQATLTVENVKHIRALAKHISNENLSALFGVGIKQIERIINRVRWRSIPPLTQEEILSIRTKYAMQYT